MPDFYHSQESPNCDSSRYTSLSAVGALAGQGEKAEHEKGGRRVPPSELLSTARRKDALRSA